MLTLLLTRHGHTLRSEPDQYLGQRIDAPLSDRGRADAARLAERLAGAGISRILSSPLPRAAETAGILAAGRLPVETDDRLMEMDYGAWEGTLVDEVETRHPADYERYIGDPAEFTFPDGEGGRQVATRVGSFISDLVEWAAGQPGGRSAQPPEPTVLVVGHSSVNRVMAATLLGVPLRDYRRRFQFDWASLSVLRWASAESGPLLLLANDVGHLRGTSGVTWR